MWLLRVIQIRRVCSKINNQSSQRRSSSGFVIEVGEGADWYSPRGSVFINKSINSYILKVRYAMDVAKDVDIDQYLPKNGRPALLFLK